MYWGPTGLLAVLAWGLAWQTLSGLYLAVTLICILVAAEEVSSRRCSNESW